MSESLEPILRPDIQQFLEKFYDCSFTTNRRSGTTKVRCPFHDDRNPSATVYLNDNRFKCWAGCFPEADGKPVDALDILQMDKGMTMAEAIEATEDLDSVAVESNGRSKADRSLTYKFLVIE